MDKIEQGSGGQIAVSVRSLSGAMIAGGLVHIAADKPVSALKQAISEAGGPDPNDQQLIVGHHVLQDSDLAGEFLSESDMIFLVTVAGCPTCHGPCACTLCGCQPQAGLIDYYGLCKECGKCGGHASSCRFCAQAFPSLCALDSHVRFIHGDREAAEWQSSRLEEHLKNRRLPGAPKVGLPEFGTFMEACRGGLNPV
ncbi:unnamed protein product [Polarella glacialis]|uniref:Ubiquitin-like domain-containing protein n=1 Tax=Polarella glacialis TaxID=89957 RepID=A0A813DHY3_POLGL|nr:unnamed protein product [Polarella glacialis]CAE8731553.1 unnamed protein product [Polarella glacialis]